MTVYETTYGDEQTKYVRVAPDICIAEQRKGMLHTRMDTNHMTAHIENLVCDRREVNKTHALCEVGTTKGEPFDEGNVCTYVCMNECMPALAHTRGVYVV